MSTPKALPDAFHMSLSIGQSLWGDLLGEALPAKLGSGRFELARTARGLASASSAQVKGLLTGVSAQMKSRPAVRAAVEHPAVQVARAQATSLWDDRKETLIQLLEQLVQVDGDWNVQVEKNGTGFAYSAQALTANVRLAFAFDGYLKFLQDTWAMPLELQQNLDATITLGDVAFDNDTKSLTACLRDVHLGVGNHPIGQLLQLIVDKVLERQVDKINPLTILKREQLENFVSPSSSGPLSFSAGVGDLYVAIDEENVTLSVRFQFDGG